MRPCVLIPAYNEGGSIGKLLDAIKGRFPKGMGCVVVDDGSTDDTSQMVISRGWIELIRHSVRQGKGKALQTGFQYIKGTDYGPVVVLDADGQHDPRDISLFLERVKTSHEDVIIGNRLNNPTGMPRVRFLTNQVMSRLLALRTKLSVPDSQCGFRLLSRRAVEQLDLACNHFEIESEILLQASRFAFKVGSVPIRSIYGSEKSRIHPISDTIRFFKFYFHDMLSRHK
jgi:glycosyltransferase involved in cell wall biosynthesis